MTEFRKTAPFVLALAATVALAQAPSTDILLLDLPAPGGGVSSVAAEAVTYLTDNDSYDNQPSFTPDSSTILYVAEDEAGQTDIYSYDVASGETTQMTDTQASEFSPQVTPDGEHITAVRIEADGVTQRLWQFGLEGSNAQPNPENVDRIGYYAFGSASTLALVRVDEETNGLPLSLYLTDLSTGETQLLASDVGVDVQKVPNREAVSFVQRNEDGSSSISTYDLASNETQRLVVTLPEVDAHAWLPDGSLLTAQGSVIYRWQGEGEWQPYIDLSEAAIDHIGRLAVSPDGSNLAFVVTIEGQ